MKVIIKLSQEELEKLGEIMGNEIEECRRTLVTLVMS